MILIFFLVILSKLQREILLSEEFKIILQLIFKTADELSSIFDVSELDNEKFQEIRKRFINYKSNYNLRFINLLQEINERQFELNVIINKMNKITVFFIEYNQRNKWG